MNELDDALAAYWDAAYWEGHRNAVHDTHDGWAQHALDAVHSCVRAAIAALAKDAERYRWLRGRAHKDGGTLAIDIAVIDGFAIGDFGEFIDATADAAISGAIKPGDAS